MNRRGVLDPGGDPTGDVPAWISRSEHSRAVSNNDCFAGDGEFRRRDNGLVIFPPGTSGPAVDRRVGGIAHGFGRAGRGDSAAGFCLNDQFENNKPATFRNPVYSFLGDWVMFRDILLGRLSIRE